MKITSFKPGDHLTLEEHPALLRLTTPVAALVVSILLSLPLQIAALVMLIQQAPMPRWMVIAAGVYSILVVLILFGIPVDAGATLTPSGRIEVRRVNAILPFLTFRRVLQDDAYRIKATPGPRLGGFPMLTVERQHSEPTDLSKISPASQSFSGDVYFVRTTADIEAFARCVGSALGFAYVRRDSNSFEVSQAPMDGSEAIETPMAQFPRGSRPLTAGGPDPIRPFGPRSLEPRAVVEAWEPGRRLDYRLQGEPGLRWVWVAGAAMFLLSGIWIWESVFSWPFLTTPARVAVTTASVLIVGSTVVLRGLIALIGSGSRFRIGDHAGGIWSGVGWIGGSITPAESVDFVFVEVEEKGPPHARSTRSRAWAVAGIDSGCLLDTGWGPRREQGLNVAIPLAQEVGAILGRPVRISGD